MNIKERIKMVKAMEFICRQINDEEVFMYWLTDGVADGDIPYGDFSTEDPKHDEAFWYCEDNEHFADLMDTFLRTIRRACKSGGLFCDGVTDQPMYDNFGYSMKLLNEEARKAETGDTEG